MWTRTIKAKLPLNVVQKFKCLSIENDEEDLIYTKPYIQSLRIRSLYAMLDDGVNC